uniref:Methyltransferase type 12 domain-containing protein n=1 Tax=Davidia involucrata TaxID=16924 RepID=A0A5B6ZX39_DAVIN
MMVMIVITTSTTAPPSTGTTSTSTTKTSSSRIDITWRRTGGDSSLTIIQCFPNGKVVLEVGCGAGNTIFPLVTTYPKLFVHACDFSPHAIMLVKSHSDFNEERINAFVCNVVNDNLCNRIMPSSIDVITLVFMLSAVCPKKMPLILQNLKKVLKPNGHVLLRDYATGDYAQVELQNRNRMISENFYVRGDGTCSFYFSEDFLSTLFIRAGFSIVDMNIYCRQIENRSRNITMGRYVQFLIITLPLKCVLPVTSL